MSYLNGIHGCSGDYAVRSLGSGPFSPAITHDSRSKDDIMFKYSIPHVFGTEWKKKLCEMRQQLEQARKDSPGTGDMTASSLLGALDLFITEELRLLPENLSLCLTGWNMTDYGPLHAGSTPTKQK